jgi:hypothetical protein
VNALHIVHYHARNQRSSEYQKLLGYFSASANPNEVLTKISDLAERRRIQNLIAQRNYCKKLKKRLEDLVSSYATMPRTAWNAVLIELQERRAASSSASPEQKPATTAIAAPGVSLSVVFGILVHHPTCRGSHVLASVHVPAFHQPTSLFRDVVFVDIPSARCSCIPNTVLHLARLQNTNHPHTGDATLHFPAFGLPLSDCI